MTLLNAFSFAGKNALVVGGATGMGAAVAELVRDSGAKVSVMDRADITLDGVGKTHIDLADRTSIDNAVDDHRGGIDALFSCAGVADGTAGIERINFIGHRHLIDRFRATGQLGRGSAIGFISSVAGIGWQANMDTLNPILDIEDFDNAADYVVQHTRADYMWSKQIINAYVARESMTLLKEGIRINAICPGNTDTPLARSQKELWLDFGSDYRDEVGVDVATALEQAYPLAFLCSDAARIITGVTLVCDAGYVSAGLTGAFPAGEFLKILIAGSA